VLVDRDGTIGPLLARISDYFVEHPGIAAEWQAYDELLGVEKARYGYEETTTIDV